MSLQRATSERGERILDLTDVLDVFEAQEGIVEHIIGKTGNGKTYEGTRRALDDLMHGRVVYTTWELIIPDVFDQRLSFEHLLMNFVFGRKDFYKFDLRENWHYVDIDRPDLIPFIESLTDCVLYMDEGQDVFDSRGGLDKAARKTITRSRHMRKTLVIISQRAQAVDVNARANVSWFYKCVKTWAWWWPFRTFFKIYKTDEMDDQNYPVWEERMPDGKMWKAPIWRSHFAEDRIFNAYNSWYLRKGKAKSQEIHVERYKLTRREMLASMRQMLFAKKPKNKPLMEVSPALLAISTPREKPEEPRKIVVQFEHEDSKDRLELPAGPEGQGIRERVRPQKARAGAKEKPRVEDKALLDHGTIRPRTQGFQPEAPQAGAETPHQAVRLAPEGSRSKPKKSRVLTPTP